MTSLPIHSAAEQVAHAEQALADAVDRQQVAAAKTAQLRERLDAVLARRAQIRADLESGKLDDRAAGGLIALVAEDEADLRRLVDEAVAAEREAEPVREQQALASARGALAQAHAAARVDVLRGHVQKAEEALLAALGAAGEALRLAGMPVALRSVWMPSNHMVRAVAHGVLPPPSAPGAEARHG